MMGPGASIGATRGKRKRRGSSKVEIVLPPPNDIEGVLFTITEVAKMLRVSKMTVYRMVHERELLAIRVGKSFRVRETALRAYVKSLG